MIFMIAVKGLMALGGAIDKFFRVKKMSYKGSGTQIAKGNLGKWQIDVYIKDKLYNINVTLDLKNFIKVGS